MTNNNLIPEILKIITEYSKPLQCNECGWDCTKDNEYWKNPEHFGNKVYCGGCVGYNYDLFKLFNRCKCCNKNNNGKNFYPAEEICIDCCERYLQEKLKCHSCNKKIDSGLNTEYEYNEEICNDCNYKRFIEENEENEETSEDEEIDYSTFFPYE